MIILKPDFNNLRKFALQKSFYESKSVIDPWDFDGNEEKIEEYKHIVHNQILKEVKECFSPVGLRNVMARFTRTETEDAYYSNAFKMVSLFDTRTKIHFIEKNGNTTIVSARFDNIVGVNPSLDVKRNASLEEMYDVVRESNFIERDYSNEEDLGFYSEPMEPSATQDNIITIKEGEDIDKVLYNRKEYPLSYILDEELPRYSKKMYILSRILKSSSKIIEIVMGNSKIPLATLD
jgi:hypothetical protein